MENPELKRIAWFWTSPVYEMAAQRGFYRFD